MSFILGRLENTPAIWVSKLAPGGDYTISNNGSVEWSGSSGDNYSVLKIDGVGGTRLAVVKRDKDGAVLWQRISQIHGLGETQFTDIKTLNNGNVVLLVGATGFFTSTQRLFMFSSGGTLLRSRSIDPNPGYATGFRLKSQTEGQIWGRGGGVFGGSNFCLLWTVSLLDDSTFGDVSDYYTYESVTPSGFVANRSNDVRLLPNGNLFMLATYANGGVIKYHCLELSPSGSTLVQVAAFTDSGSVQYFEVAMPFADGSVVLSNTLGRHLKIDSTFNQVWYKQARLIGAPLYPVLDAYENMYFAGRDALGDALTPNGWIPIDGNGFCSACIGAIDKDFTSLAYSTWTNNGTGSNGGTSAADCAYLGTNSGIDIANRKFIYCAATGDHVMSHQFEMPSVTTQITMPGGFRAKAGSQFNTTTPIDEPTLTVIRTVPTMSIATNTVSYVSESWSFTDPGASLSWNLFVP